ncbi:hypothetical protein MTBGP_09810 [Moorella thermoacetica]|uniref:hypothetical protein n=1 Tax=Neomoorella thermoacetica TaxID=1525 RepID=UPI0030CA6226
MFEEHPKYEYLDIQQTFFVWYRSDKGYYWDEEAKPGGQFDITLDGTKLMLTDERERQIRLEKKHVYGPFSPFLLEVPETTGYYPLNVLEEEPTLFLKFAEVTPTRKGILEFANNYGMLTYGETQVLTPKYRIESGQKGSLRTRGAFGITKVIEEGLTADNYAIVFGESLRFWQNEIRDMAWAVLVWEALKDKNTDILKRIIYWKGEEAVGYVLVNINKEALLQFYNAEEVLRATRPDNWNNFKAYLPEEVTLSTSSGWLATKWTSRRELFSRFKPGDLLLPAQYLLQSSINKKLKKYITKPRLLLDDKNNLQPYLMPENLLSAMWYQFYLTVIGEKKYKRCSICGLWADVTDKRSNWSKHPECANRARVKKCRERQKSEVLTNGWLG